MSMSFLSKIGNWLTRLLPDKNSQAVSASNIISSAIAGDNAALLSLVVAMFRSCAYLIGALTLVSYILVWASTSDALAHAFFVDVSGRLTTALVSLLGGLFGSSLLRSLTTVSSGLSSAVRKEAAALKRSDCPTSSPKMTDPKTKRKRGGGNE